MPAPRRSAAARWPAVICSQVSGISYRAGRPTVGRMPEFLAETYAPCDAPGTATPRAGDLTLAAEQASRPGAQVRFLCAVVVPGEETCFWLYQAPSVGMVRVAMTRAGLRPERITQAVTVRPPRVRQGRRNQLTGQGLPTTPSPEIAGTSSRSVRRDSPTAPGTRPHRDVSDDPHSPSEATPHPQDKQAVTGQAPSWLPNANHPPIPSGARRCQQSSDHRGPARTARPAAIRPGRRALWITALYRRPRPSCDQA